MLELRGVKTSGFGAASNTLRSQLEIICENYPEIGNCHFGTINVVLESDLIILNPDHRTNEIIWNTSYRAEAFDFLRIELVVPRLQKSYKAWLYIAHNSPHRNRLNFHEIICEKIDDLADSECVIIRIDKESKLPRYQFRAIHII